MWWGIKVSGSSNNADGDGVVLVNSDKGLIVGANAKDGNNDGLVDSPKSAPAGGVIRISFGTPTVVNSVAVSHIENAGAYLMLHLAKGDSKTIPVAVTGKDGMGVVDVNVNDCLTLELHLKGPGALHNVSFCPDDVCEPVCIKACGSDGCGGSCGECTIPDGGACDGPNFVKCVDGCPLEQDCAGKGKICGYADWLNKGKGGYGCIEPGSGGKANP